MTVHSTYNQPQAEALVLAFRRALDPLMADIAPDWLLHHIELVRRHEPDAFTERVEVRLVLKPLGEAREVPERAPLPAPTPRISR